MMLKFLLPLVATAATASAQQPVTLEFSAVVGDLPLACGQTYQNVGSGNTTIEFQDARLYISNVRLITAEGEEVAVTLEQDGLWQFENVALLDFEDATSGCSDVGTTAINNQIRGTVPEADYSGLAFDLGVPFDLNHSDATTAPSPLNVTSLFWSWQYGYKFARIEILNEQTAMSGTAVPNDSGGMDMGDGGGAPSNFWPIHLGSTGCTSPAPVVGPAAACTRPNLSTVHLEPFNPMSDIVTLDIAGLLEGVNVGQSLELAPPGCMSGFDDPDCKGLFSNFGLALKTGQPAASQRLFSVTIRGAQADR